MKKELEAHIATAELLEQAMLDLTHERAVSSQLTLVVQQAKVIYPVCFCCIVFKFSSPLPSYNFTFGVRSLQNDSIFDLF